MAYHGTFPNEIWVNDGYNVDKVSVGHWSMAARLGVARVAAISNGASERVTPALTVNHCVLACG